MFKKLMLKISLITFFLPVVNLVSCSNQENYINFSDPNKIVIASSIPKTWPQYQSTKKIIEDYNKNQAKNDNYMPVKFMSQEDTNSNSYSELSSKINKLLNTENVPNIIISNFNAVYELSSKDRLINLQSQLLRRDIFDNKFIQGRTKLKHPKYQDGIWAVPYTVTTNSSLVVNKPVMKEIISLMVNNHGMKVDSNKKSNPFLFEVMNTKNSIDKYDKSIKEGFTKPSELWIDNSNFKEDLSEYKITDKTFTSFSGLYEFAKKSKETLNLKQPPYIFGSYFANDFLSILDSQSGASDNNFPLFKERKNKKGFDFPFLENEREREKLKKSFDVILELIKSNSVNKPEKYNIVGLRNGQFAFSTMPSVSARYSYNSKTFGGYTNNGFAFEDFVYLPQISKFKNSNSYGSYSLAESMLMGIKTTPKKDKAVKAFIDYIYTKNMTSKNNETSLKVTDFLAKESGYVIPLKANTTEKAIKKYRSIYNDYLNNQNGKVDDENHSKSAIYRSIVNTFESINNGLYRSFNGDQYTTILLSLIKEILEDVIRKPSEYNSEKIIAKIIEREREYNVYKVS